jgi:hypothetical protein
MVLEKMKILKFAPLKMNHPECKPWFEAKQALHSIFILGAVPQKLSHFSVNRSANLGLPAEQALHSILILGAVP